MKRRSITLILTAALSTIGGSSILNAQNEVETATVPFAFHTEGHSLPAGDYTVRETSSNGVFRLTAADGQSLFITTSQRPDADPNKPSLKFARYGNEYVLSGISMPGETVGYGMSQNAIQKDLTHKAGVAAMISVPLKAR